MKILTTWGHKMDQKFPKPKFKKLSEKKYERKMEDETFLS